MWRVYLPTATQGLSGYQDGDVLVRFERTDRDDRYGSRSFIAERQGDRVVDLQAEWLLAVASFRGGWAGPSGPRSRPAGRPWGRVAFAV